jgi:hypothetical protein
MMEVQASTTEMAGKSRLDQIRASMGGSPATPQVTSGSSNSSSASQSIQAEIAQRVAQEQKANPQGN